MTGNTDPRVEAAWNVHDQSGPNMTAILAAADAADREQGIHRVRVDETTVERVAVALMNSQFARHGLSPRGPERLSPKAVIDARAVLAALTGADS